MGLEQRGYPGPDSLVGRCTSSAGFNRPSSFDLGFSKGFPRRSFLKTAGVALLSFGLPGKPAYAQTATELPTGIDPREQLLSDKVANWQTEAVKQLGDDFHLTGERLSKLHRDSLGYDSVLFQTMLVSLDPTDPTNPTGRLILRNLITEIERNGYNTYDVPSFLGDPLPQPGVYTIDIPLRIARITAVLGSILGFNAQITGAEDLDWLNSFRIGDDSGDKFGLMQYTQGIQTGLIRLAHTGHLAPLAQVIARDMMLAHGEGTLETFIYPTDFPERFGDLERDSLEFINRGKKTGLAPGDPVLYQNILWARDNYAVVPDIKRRIFTYDSVSQMDQTPDAPRYDLDPNKTLWWPWNAWGTDIPLVDRGRRQFPPTFRDGQIRVKNNPDNSQEFHLSLPEPLPNITPHRSQWLRLSIPDVGERFPIFLILFSYPDPFVKGQSLLRYTQDSGHKVAEDPRYLRGLPAQSPDEYLQYRLPFYIVYKG